MRRSAIAAATLFLVAASAVAQDRDEPRRSQRGSVMQMVADARIEIRYSRPVARGRDLFGALVKWGEVWTPGADSATTIEVNRDIRVNGETLPAGKYSVWSIPGESAWTIIFNKQHAAFHTRYPGESQDQLRIRVQPRTGSQMETLAWYFPVVDGYTATLYLHWGTTVVPLSIRVDE
jgi:DUF2911 family protein